MTRVDRTVGCLLGGAVGDALGAPVEFLGLDEIRAAFGDEGIRDLAPAYGRVGAITDDTQMSLFTAEGILRTYARIREHGDADYLRVLDHAYLRWLATQEPVAPGRFPPGCPDGWLWELHELHSPRAPGWTCVGAVRADELGTIERPINHSKGCGGVMRIAPVGLALELDAVGVDAFAAGSRIAALTHGHASGFLAAGVQAAVVRALVVGRPLARAISDSVARLQDWPGYEETLAAVEAAFELAGSSVEPGPDAVARLGRGAVAEEALAIGLYCALVADDFVHGVRLAVNHGGDSDSTGAIAGNLLGVMGGVAAIPAEWLAELELRDEIERLARDLVELADARVAATEEALRRYPPS